VWGDIFILTLDQSKLSQPTQVAVTSTQILKEINSKPTRTCNIGGNPNNCQYVAGQPAQGGRQVTGLVVRQGSTSGQIELFVSHSDPRYGYDNNDDALAIDTYSGSVTRLILGPNISTPDPNDYSVVSNQDLVVGLPRSRENHSVNGMDFGPDGWLYISSPGHTNYGQPSTFFSYLPEYYLSAAVLRLNVNGLGTTPLPLDMQSVRTAADMSPFANKFELFATGFRNGYDIVWHSNGKLYLNDNGGNDGYGNTPNSGDGCNNTPSINPGNGNDQLHWVAQNSYGGHPNPARNQCVLNDGRNYTPNLPSPSNYSAPAWLYDYFNGVSTNGIAEYTSNVFGGQMRGNLISATYAGDRNVRRVVLNSSGTAATQEVAMGQFNQPIDVATDSDGRIYVADFPDTNNISRIMVMIPDETVLCNNAANADDDGDGYSDADEATHGTDPCSRASYPADFDRDLIGDLTDPDDDNDGILDTQDQLFFDTQNGAGTGVPLGFEWNPGTASLGGVAHTGFSGTHMATSGSRTNTDVISVGAAGGFMGLQTFSGTAQGAANSQVNALQIGFDSTSNFRIWSEVVEPFNSDTPASGHVGGIFFGPNQDNFIRLAVTGAAGGQQLVQLGYERNGTFNTIASANLGTAKIFNLDLRLVGDPATKKVTAYYELNTSGTLVLLRTVNNVPVAWFNNNTGTNKNTSLAGVVTSHGSAPATTFAYDYFRIDRQAAGAPAANLGLTSNAVVSSPQARSGEAREQEQGRLKIDDLITYNIKVKNEGPTAATAVAFESDIPDKTSFVEATINQGSCTPPTNGNDKGIIKCNLGNMARGATVDVTITVKVKKSPRGARIINVSKVASGTYDPDEENNVKRTVID
jgi:uncharacterized repeat protein (TIGR01451 family)